MGKFAYDELFFKLLNDTGYEIRFDNSEIEQSIEMEVARAAALEGAYISNYIDIKSLSELRAIDIEKKARSGKASSLELLQLQAYNFDKFVIKTTKMQRISEEDIMTHLQELALAEAYDAFLARATAAKMSLQQLIETDLYNMYYNKRDIRSYIENVVKEKRCSNIKITIRNNKDSVKVTQKDVLKLESIKYMCSVLGLQSSIDDGTKITEEKVMTYFTYYKNMSEIEKQIFDENFGIGVLKAKDEALRAKQLANLVLKRWNGCGFDRRSLSYSRKGEVRKRSYEYFVAINCDMILKFFYKTIN